MSSKILADLSKLQDDLNKLKLGEDTRRIVNEVLDEAKQEIQVLREDYSRMKSKALRRRRRRR